jgi:hypothetical protein
VLLQIVSHGESSSEPSIYQDQMGQTFVQNFRMDGAEHRPKLVEDVNGNLSDLPVFDFAESPREERLFVRQHAQGASRGARIVDKTVESRV